MPADTTTGSPPMIGRVLRLAEWLGYVRDYDFGRISPARVVLHHTWAPTIAQWRGLASMRGMQTFYRRKGWTAAPHIYVSPERGPNVWLFNPMSEVGIHAGRGNSGIWNGRWGYSVGVEMVGDYDDERPSGMVWDGTKAVLGGLSRRLGIAPRQLISFHRDYTNEKSCPGWAVTHEWVWSEIEQWLREHPTLPTPAPTPVLVERYVVRDGAKATIRLAPNRPELKKQPSNIVEQRASGREVLVIGSTNQGEFVAGSTTWYITSDQRYVHSSAVVKVREVGKAL